MKREEQKKKERPREKTLHSLSLSSSLFSCCVLQKCFEIESIKSTRTLIRDNDIKLDLKEENRRELFELYEKDSDLYFNSLLYFFKGF